MLVVFADDERQVIKTTIGWIKQLYKNENPDEETKAAFQKSIDNALSKLVNSQNGDDCCLVESLNTKFLICNKLETVIENAKNAINPNEPILWLLDLSWGGEKSFPILKQIKSSEFKHWPVVIYTKSNDDSDVQEAYRNHANAYLHKPDTDAKDRKEAFKNVIETWRSLFSLPIASSSD